MHKYARILIFLVIPTVLAGLGILFPMWTIEFNSPVYGQRWAGISVHALNGIVGPVDQVNIINHYVGLGEIKPEEVNEVRILPLVYVGFVALAIAAGILRDKRVSIIPWVLSLIIIVGVLGSIYAFIYTFAHTIDPTAPMKVDRIPIPIIGSDQAGNFKLRASIGLGLYLPLIATLIQTPTPIIARLRGVRQKAKPAIRVPIAILMIALLMQGFLAQVGAEQVSHDQVLQELVDAMPAGGVLHLRSGTYLGPVKITKPFTIEGDGYPIVDGRGEGNVILVTANDVSISGLRIVNSNPDISMDSAGIKVLGNNSRISGNIIENTLFGVYLQGARNALVERNTMAGFTFKDMNDKGHGVYLWYAFDAAVKDNGITGFKDGIQIDHSYTSRIEGNKITSSRYGMHLMYSEQLKIIGNVISENLVGMAIMYSQNLEVTDNTVKENKGLAISEGIVVRESGDISVERNTIYGHLNGLTLEYSPYPPRAVQIIRDNMIAFNYVGVVIDSNSGGLIQRNNFVENLEHVKITGASAPRVRWTGNFWSDYRGLGDVAYKIENPLQDITDDFPQLSVFAFSPAYLSLELMKKALPINARARAVDDAPMTKPSQTLASAGFQRDYAWLLTAALLTFAPILSILTILRRSSIGNHRSH